MSKHEILLVTRSANEELYSLTSSLLGERLPREKVEPVDDLEILSRLHLFDAQWVVLLDEGAFVAVPERIAGLVAFMEEEGFDCCGLPSGGVVPVARGNPLLCHPFFVVLNAKRMRQVFKKKPVPVGDFDPDFQEKLPKHLMRGEYSLSAKAPYQSFFYSLHKKSLRILWLDAVQWAREPHTTVLADHTRRPFLLQPWGAEQFVEQKPRFEQVKNFAELVQQQL